MNCSNVFSESRLPWKASACVIHQTIFKTKMTSCHKKPSVVEVDRLKKMKDTFRGSQRVRATNPPTLRIFESQGRSRFWLWIHLQLPSLSPLSEQDRLTEFLSYRHFISTSHISTIRFVFFLKDALQPPAFIINKHSVLDVFAQPA